MDPVTLILTALAAGAAVGATDTATTAVGEAYQGLKRLIVARFGNNTSAESALNMFESSPDETIAAYLRPYLEDSAISQDADIAAAAEGLLGLAGGSSTSIGGGVTITGRVTQHANRGGVAQIGTAGSISTNWSGAEGNDLKGRDSPSA